MTIKNMMKDIESGLNRLCVEMLDRERKQYHFWCARNRVPKGAKPIEAYETDSEIIILFADDEYPSEDHSCDEMGCSTLSHVKMRIPKQKGASRQEATDEPTEEGRQKYTDGHYEGIPCTCDKSCSETCSGQKCGCRACSSAYGDSLDG